MTEPATGTAPRPILAAEHPAGKRPAGPRSRLRAMVAGAAATVMGAAPHVLHHVGPLAGAAVLAGSTGRLVFGALAFLMTIPLLRRIHGHSGSWMAPALALAAMTGLFALSSFVIGPALTGGSRDARSSPAPTQEVEPAGHESHHAS